MFITNRTEQHTEEEETQWVLEGGCRWIQLRMKDSPSIETARELVKLCAPYQARLCIDDDVQMALESGATAVHLGKNDMPVDQACELVHKSGKTDFLRRYLPGGPTRCIVHWIRSVPFYANQEETESNLRSRRIQTHPRTMPGSRHYLAGLCHWRH